MADSPLCHVIIETFWYTSSLEQFCAQSYMVCVIGLCKDPLRSTGALALLGNCD